MSVANRDLFGHSEIDVDDPERELTADRLAEILGLSKRHILRLASDGVLPRTPKGRYPLARSVQSYLAHLDQQRRKQESERDGDEALRFRRARAEQTELAVARARGEVVTVHEHQLAVGAALAAVSQRFLMLPRATCRQLDPAEPGRAKAILEEYVHAARESAYAAILQLSDSFTDPDAIQEYEALIARRRRPQGRGTKRKKSTKRKAKKKPRNKT